MNLPWRLKLLAGRVRRRLGPLQPPRELALTTRAGGRSVLDVGCMWGVHGRFSFLAEETGATRVTGIDVMGRTPQFDAEHARRGSSVRFIEGDLHDPAVVREAGEHDLVWCSGVLYHSPFPVLTLRRLRELTGELLILQTNCVPELPGVAQGMVFYPHLPETERGLYGMWGRAPRERSIGPLEGFPDEFGPWWWGITRSALRAMLASAGFAIEEEWGDPFSVTATARPL